MKAVVGRIPGQRILLSALLVVAWQAPALGQLSPGPLSRAHATLDGPTKCTSCHEFGVAKPRFKCTDCHKEIRIRLEQQRGYHTRVAAINDEGRDCVGCHLEHHGRDYELVYFPSGRQRFDHEETGYTLKGMHVDLKCEQCHTAERIPAAELETLQVKDPRRTLLGLPTNCLGCHADEHHGQFAADCERCHGQTSWKKPPLFDHNETSFGLTGRHEQLQCEKCHHATLGPEIFVRYVGIEHGSCESCHKDPHQKAFSESCESCHTTSGWKGTSPGTRFDHSSSNFPLVGKHTIVTCRQCHQGLEFSKAVAHARCADCHNDDPHKGQFQGRVQGSDCAACHNEEAFKPALFGIEEHQLSGYPLEGKHAKVACDKCHEPEPAGIHYRLPHETCGRCHDDAHAGQFAGPPNQNRCDSCHSVEGFRPATFTVARHQTLDFVLAGGHRAVACSECHTETTLAGSTTARYRFDEVTCAECHESPHGQQFRIVAGTTDAGFACTDCHTDRTWSRLADFPHSDTAFPLLGAHEKVACVACHFNDNQKSGVKDVVFKTAPKNCQGCHEDPHAGQFDTGERKQACSVCHTNFDWQPTQFDHQQYSRFSLQGAHEKVACRQCHLKREGVGEAEFTVYRGTPTDCSDCHGQKYPDQARKTL